MELRPVLILCSCDQVLDAGAPALELGTAEKDLFFLD
jgi:hypothetical protein